MREIDDKMNKISITTKIKGCSYTNFAILSRTYWKEFKIWFHRDSIKYVEAK